MRFKVQDRCGWCLRDTETEVVLARDGKDIKHLKNQIRKLEEKFAKSVEDEK